MQTRQWGDRRREDTDEHTANMSSRLHMGQKRFSKLSTYQAISRLCEIPSDKPLATANLCISLFFFPVFERRVCECNTYYC